MKLILVGDCHIRKKNPVARTDDIFDAFKRKWQFIKDLSGKYKAPIIQSGDLTEFKFDRSSFKADFINELLDVFDKDGKIFSCIGNHDVLGDRTDLVHQTALGTLVKTGCVNIYGAIIPVIAGRNSKKIHIHSCPWKKDPSTIKIASGFNILIWHVMTWKGDKPWKGCEDPDCVRLLRKYPQFDLIVTGHNHETFVHEEDGRFLINPGGLLRTSADEGDKTPYVFIFDTDTKQYKQIEIPHEKGVVSRGHIETLEQREERLDGFIDKVKMGFSVEMDYESNLRKFLEENKTKQDVRDIIENAIGDKNV